MRVDKHLLAMLSKYDGWLRQRKISYAGRIVPVGEAFRPTDWVLPTQQGIAILRRARTLALADCVCRAHYRRCDGPLDTCLLTDGAAEAFVRAGRAERIWPERAEGVLRKASACGLAHQVLYSPEQYAFAVCSCCPCCCYRLQILLLFDRRDLVVRSDYMAVVAEDGCVSCGSCVERCLFGARQIVDGQVVYHPARCYGCGLCVTVCPEGAIGLQVRRVEHPGRSGDRP
jgi:NAD-dependent dihydropyrimidine dehydrogenase PreA subunit